MSITNNVFKLRSSCVKYDKFNNMLPQRGKFSDIDMFHVYNGERLFIELKHYRGYYKYNNGLSKAIIDAFHAGTKKGEFSLVLWGEYTDVNWGTDDYYSDFSPTMALLFSPEMKHPRFYKRFTEHSFKKFIDYWYDYVDNHTHLSPTPEIIEDDELISFS